LSCGEYSEEIFDVISRRKLDRYLDPTIRIETAKVFIEKCRQIRLGPIESRCRDANDDYLLQLAVDGHADILVTGDKDMLTLRLLEGAEIISPSDFLGRTA